MTELVCSLGAGLSSLLPCFAGSHMLRLGLRHTACIRNSHRGPANRSRPSMHKPMHVCCRDQAMQSAISCPAPVMVTAGTAAALPLQ